MKNIDSNRGVCTLFGTTNTYISYVQQLLIAKSRFCFGFRTFWKYRYSIWSIDI